MSKVVVSILGQYFLSQTLFIRKPMSTTQFSLMPRARIWMHFLSEWFKAFNKTWRGGFNSAAEMEQVHPNIKIYSNTCISICRTHVCSHCHIQDDHNTTNSMTNDFRQAKHKKLTKKTSIQKKPTKPSYTMALLNHSWGTILWDLLGL